MRDPSRWTAPLAPLPLLALVALCCAQPAGMVDRANIADLVEIVVERTEGYVGSDPPEPVAWAIGSLRRAVIESDAEEVPLWRIDGDLEIVLQAHDQHVQADPELPAALRDRYLRSSELLREVVAAGQRAPPGDARAGP